MTESMMEECAPVMLEIAEKILKSAASGMLGSEDLVAWHK